MPATSSFEQIRGGLNRIASAEAPLGPVEQLQLVHELNRVVDALWIAGVALVDLAERTADHSRQRALAIQVANASEQLWMALDAADALYCSLAGMCDASSTVRLSDGQ